MKQLIPVIWYTAFWLIFGWGVFFYENWKRRKNRQT
jgi:hypothetical protein